MADNIDTDSTNATILAAEEASVAVNSSSMTTTGSYAQLMLGGWALIPVSPDPQAFAKDSYVGAAFYKVINGVTEVIIANQGSENLYDFAVSDVAIAANGTPACDPDALAYYNAVVDWVKNPANGVNVTNGTAGPINVIETGHSLGGQEADYVEAEAAAGQPIPNVTTEAISFDAPGQSTNTATATSGATYNALNISLVTEGVHVGGSALNAGYLGGSVTISGGANGAAVGVAAAAVVNPAVGLLGWLLTTYGYNHVTTRLQDYFTKSPALGGVDLQTYAPTQVTQPVVAALEGISAQQYNNSSDPAGLIAGAFTQGSASASPTASSSAGAAESFTETSTADGFVLQGSLGDSITATISGNQETLVDNYGDKAILAFNSAGTALTGYTTSFGDPTTSTTSIATDGSSTTKTTYESGAYATTIDDGQGNITTDYFTKNGVETSSTWVHSDGTSGSVTSFHDGLSTVPGAPNDIYDAAAYILQNPDGSYSTIGANAPGQITTTAFAADGSQTSQSTDGGDGVNDLTVANTSQVYSGGSEYTNQYNSAGVAVGDTWYNANPDGSPDGAAVYVGWAQADCTSGSEVLNASGVYVKNDTALDGSSYRETVESNGTTVSHYNAQGVLLSDQWSVTDGKAGAPSVTGSDTFNADGSGSGTFTDTRDGTSGTVTLNGQGSIVVVNTDAGGTVTSEDIWNGDGTYEVAMLNADGSTQATYDYLANGDVTVTDLAPGGSVADQQTVAAGLVINPDGSDFSKVLNADGSYTVYYEDAQGDTTAFQYGVKPKRSGCALRRPRRVRHGLRRATRFTTESIASSEHSESASGRFGLKLYASMSA